MLMTSWQSNTKWPLLPYARWKDTLDTLHMYMQIVGKVKLALSPFLNQWWEVAFSVTPNGMTTGRIPYKDFSFAIDFDFIHHYVRIYTNYGQEIILPLRPISVALFYKEFFEALKTLGISVKIYPVPVEFAHPISFAKDTKHHSYDRAYVSVWFGIVLKTSLIFDTFRSSFRGKSSPIHFFWGSFDVAGTRFSGSTATPPKLQGVMNKIIKLSENEENFTFGFWPGDIKFPHPAFYSYIYPAPKGYQEIPTGSATAYFDKKMSLCILLYEKFRKAKNPERELLNFLSTTYTQYAQLGNWNIRALRNTTRSGSRG